jgi:hypothetical protein
VDQGDERRSLRPRLIQAERFSKSVHRPSRFSLRLGLGDARDCVKCASTEQDRKITGLNLLPLEVVVGETDGIFSVKRDACALNEFKKIDRSIPIVSETEKILNRRIFPLKSKA